MSKVPPYIAFLAKLVIGFAVLALLLTRVDMDEVVAAARRLEPTTVGAAVTAYFAAHVISALRLRVLLPELTLFQSWRFTMIAVLYGTALPGQVAGEAVKALRLARAAGSSYGRGTAVAAVAVDKAMAMFALLLLMALGVGLEGGRFGRPVVVAAGILTVFAALAFLVLLLAPLPQWLGRWGEVLTTWRELRLGLTTLLKAVSLGVLFQILSIGVFVMLGGGLGIHLSPPAWAVVVGLVSVVLLLPVTVAGIGLRDGSLVAVLGLLGYEAGPALALSFVLLAINLAGAAIGFIADVAGRDR